MPIDQSDPKPIDAIRKRSEELAASAGQHTAEGETLAAMLEGTLTFDEVDEETLLRCLELFGPDRVVDALLDAGRNYGQDVEPPAAIENRQVATSPSGETVIPMPRMTRFSGRSWNSRLGWAAAAMIIVGVWVYRTTIPSHSQLRDIADNPIILRWPAQRPFNPSTMKEWGMPAAPLLKGEPDFGAGPTTLGSVGGERAADWRLATVVVRSQAGWGSGAFISADGWILSTYDVVAAVAQQAGLTGAPASLDVITATIVNGQAKPQPALQATLYRADPVHDLALLKLNYVSPAGNHFHFFRIASRVQDGEDCFVIGAGKNKQQGGRQSRPVRSGNVLRQFVYPENLSQLTGSAPATNKAPIRRRVRVIATDIAAAEGESGGPLLNAEGELIGLTFSSADNSHSRAVSWHIALPNLRNLISRFPTYPEGVPFDPWTAGLPEATLLAPGLEVDTSGGRYNSLRYFYAGNPGLAASQPLAITTFLDFNHRVAARGVVKDLVPFGLWDMEDRGGFRFDVFVTLRADQWTAVGYTNQEGVVDEIRLGRESQIAWTIWQRDADGRWMSSRASGQVPLIDPKRFSGNDLERLKMMMNRTAEHD